MGAVNLIPSTAQRQWWSEIVTSGLIIPTYLRIMLLFTGDGIWLSQELLEAYLCSIHGHGRGLSREPYPDIVWLPQSVFIYLSIFPVMAKG